MTSSVRYEEDSTTNTLSTSTDGLHIHKKSLTGNIYFPGVLPRTSLPLKELPVLSKDDYLPDRWRPKPTISELVSLIWQLKRLLFDVLMREDSCFSPTWIHSATELQHICDWFFRTSAPPIMQRSGLPSVPEELSCAAALLEVCLVVFSSDYVQFIKGLHGNDCSPLMHQYSLLARRVAQTVMHLSSAEILRRNTPVYYRNASKRASHLPYISSCNPLGYEGSTIGIMGPDDLSWVYSDLSSSEMLSGTTPFIHKDTGRASVSQTPLKHSNNMVPIPPVMLPHYQSYPSAYYCDAGSGSSFLTNPRNAIGRYDEQLVSNVDTGLKHTQHSRLDSRKLVLDSSANSSYYVGQQSVVKAPIRHDSSKPFIAGPWDVYREELLPDVPPAADFDDDSSNPNTTR
uniref:Uncharacterized protein n=1 Tax=Babesia bovis TaxID=5865 RepID=S6BI41_BABBO|nr:hypothetical protein [Babesia bovis]